MKKIDVAAIEAAVRGAAAQAVGRGR
jgi:hypothetical protein